MKLKPHLNLAAPPNESGFTIIESLLAVVVVAILIVGIGPIVAFSAATRVQARRGELGLQAARGFMNGVVANTIADPPINQTGNGAEPVALQLDDVIVPPSGDINCPTANTYCNSPVDTNAWALYCVDQDGDNQCTSTSPKDFVIQAFGLQAGVGTDPANYNNTNVDEAAVRPDAGYQIGIRVYRANAFGQNPAVILKKSSDNPNADRAQTQASLVTSGMGSRALPIVEMTTAINTSQTNLDAYCTRINIGTNQGQCN
ncbi:MAG: hypothetical protein F6J87_05625 [Spirulina sp. SIO3F2]|nr:hypothetical protein [Spirulina sp. SIO3F2]